MAEQSNSKSSAPHSNNDERRSDADASGNRSTPGSNASARDPKDVRTSGAEGGAGISGQGMQLKDERKQKDPIDYTNDPMRKAESSGTGNWSGRDSQRGTNDTSTGSRGSGDSANQIDHEYGQS